MAQVKNEQLAKMTIPTLPSGAQFDTTKVSGIGRMGTLIPCSRVAICQRGSHCAMYGDQEAYFRDLLQFIDDVEAGTF